MLPHLVVYATFCIKIRVYETYQKKFLSGCRDGVTLTNSFMKRIYFSLFFILVLTGVKAQTDPSLLVRLDSFMKVNHLLDFEKVMDFTYPKLFTIAPREQMIELMQNTFDNEEMTSELDSLQTGKIWPEIKTDEGSFVKVDYTMVMRMKFKRDPADTTDEMETLGMIAGLMEGQFGEGNVRIDSATKKINIKVNTALVAIKDSISPQWTFINFKKEEAMTSMLLSQDIIDKLSAQQ